MVATISRESYKRIIWPCTRNVMKKKAFFTRGTGPTENSRAASPATKLGHVTVTNLKTAARLCARYMKGISSKKVHLVFLCYYVGRVKTYITVHIENLHQKNNRFDVCIVDGVKLTPFFYC